MRGVFKLLLVIVIIASFSFSYALKAGSCCDSLFAELLSSDESDCHSEDVSSNSDFSKKDCCKGLSSCSKCQVSVDLRFVKNYRNAMSMFGDVTFHVQDINIKPLSEQPFHPPKIA